VAATNENAIAFYGHLGWDVLRKGEDEWYMGIRLKGSR
jgi:hypothetical protein